MRLPVLRPRELERIFLKLGFVNVQCSLKGLHAIIQMKNQSFSLFIPTKFIPRQLLAKMLKNIKYNP